MLLSWPLESEGYRLQLSLLAVAAIFYCS